MATFLPFYEARASVAAAGRTFGVGELVEEILQHLPLADLIRCRRVCKKFRDTVVGSKTTRQRLFLERDDQSEQIPNPLAPIWFARERSGYRDNTIAARIDILDLWEKSAAEVKPLYDQMLVAQPPATQCVIPVGNHTTIFFRRTYADGMTFGDLERAVIAAFEIRKGRKSSRERLQELSDSNTVLIYWE